jgi:hypothetical protein
MFGLPIETFFLLVGPPLVWIVYTFVYLRITRHWKDQSDTDSGS